MLIFDIETNGLLDTLTKLHVLVIYDTEDGSYKRYQITEESLKEGVNRLANASAIAGHNIIGFDIPALMKLYPNFYPKGDVLDTLVLARLAWPDIKNQDFNRKDFDKKLIGSHSLKAYGHRLKILKGDFGEEADWSTWSQEMSDYCEQDVRVTVELMEKIKLKNLSAASIQLEHSVQWIIQRQIRHGFLFDEKKAELLYAILVQRREDLRRDLETLFPPWLANGGLFVPKKDNKSRKYLAGCPMSKLELTYFNPGSRDHIAFCLKKKYNWKPEVFTPSGKPKIDETVLSTLPYDEAKKLAEYFLLDKRLGQLAGGEQAWLTSIGKDNRIHGYVNSNGAVTGRMTHSRPNVAQVPSVASPYGEECRELFKVPRGYKLVGCDASGLELRCLAHYMAAYDDGAYANEVVNGDIHTSNQMAAGLPTRNNAKTFIYAFLYGAGDEKIGKIIGKGKEAGARLKAKFFKATPAIKKLVDAVQTKARTQGYLVGLDGRKLSIRAEHAALNTLLQSAGALIMKQYLVFLDRNLTTAGVDYEFVANIHDEVQMEVKESQAELAATIATQTFAKVTEHFNFKCPLEGEAKIGNNWKETH